MGHVPRGSIGRKGELALVGLSQATGFPSSGVPLESLGFVGVYIILKTIPVFNLGPKF